MCEAGQIFCKSGECLDEKVRCDARYDCSDGSDEDGCGGVPIPSALPQPPGCRADTQIACPHSSTRICEVQRCDGEENCPKRPGETVAWDERGCIDYDIDGTTTETPAIATFSVLVVPRRVAVDIGTSTELQCTVTNPDVAVQYVWSRRDGQEIVSDSYQTSILRLTNFQATMAGVYQCKAFTESHSATDVSVVEVKRCSSTQFKCSSLKCIDQTSGL